jgi:hypothetical protein
MSVFNLLLFVVTYTSLYIYIYIYCKLWTHVFANILRTNMYVATLHDYIITKCLRKIVVSWIYYVFNLTWIIYFQIISNKKIPNWTMDKPKKTHLTYDYIVERFLFDFGFCGWGLSWWCHRHNMFKMKYEPSPL